MRNPQVSNKPPHPDGTRESPCHANDAQLGAGDGGDSGVRSCGRLLSNFLCTEFTLLSDGEAMP